jgi:uncharacterized protein YodC (DUF2158 family)
MFVRGSIVRSVNGGPEMEVLGVSNDGKIMCRTFDETFQEWYIIQISQEWLMYA